MKVTILLRSPFLEKIPSLKTLVINFAQRGVDVEIISSKDNKYPVPDFKDFSNIKMTLIRQRSKKMEAPTSLKLLQAVLRSILYHKSDYYIGGDDVASGILHQLKKVFHIKYINFILEYPDINNSKELKNIESADYIITHDHWHGNFISKYCSIRTNQMLFLPNASYTNAHKEHDNYLSTRLNISSDKLIILHSGGLGEWFCSKELALSAKKWDSSYVLVFHTSHIVENNPDFIEIKKEVDDSKNILFSTTPVPNIELDQLVASAKIGIATYSLKVLGYRAENMGLAAGKIGNYLKCGIPVIATKVDSLSYLEDYHCGILVENTDMIKDAIATIMKDYDTYMHGAYQCYTELWHPKKYCDAIYDTLFKG